MESHPRAHMDSNAMNVQNVASCQGAMAWTELGRILGPVLSAGAEFGLWADVTDVLNPEFLDLIRTFERENETKALSLAALTVEYSSLKSLVSSKAEAILASLNAKERAVLHWRILASKPWTLEGVGVQLGLTRERVRQLQKAVKHRIDTDLGLELAVLASIVKRQLGPVVLANDFHRTLHALGPEASAEGVGLIVHTVQDRLAYSAGAGLHFSPEAMQVVGELKRKARTLADEVNLVDEEELKKGLSDASWLPYWDQLLVRCGFFNHFGVLALRDSNRVRAKAALVAIGRPAARKEIADMCGLSEQRVSSYLSSFKSVVRAGADRWGLADWVDDVYQGIPASIAQRIKEDNGSTSVERLLQELPAKFGIKENSVMAYMHTARFAVQDGFVRFADTSSFAYRPLADVADGHDENGSPFWLFRVEERHFRGYSITGVPMEIAHALGCEPGGKIKVPVINAPGARDLSVIWDLSSTTGISIGYVSDSLRLLGAKEGEKAKIILGRGGKVSLALHKSRPADKGDPDLLLERKRERGAI